ncbi:Mitochondrial carrier protein [Babesia microti strain RI]|uniref:Mitochondrial carrier protein n=1 Tax=Babesia microti (strain RI) TaxID=1133968 RepID=A0A1N6LWQ1_BABMR|nr:Mitochondrial carrier protein [Babesia microti strain RI]SIO73307.1 Mitochondrial carrier protein [Babesia microti strain RI]|eukprot:XP_021337409.1 Mitochondrial carrier protein [Babesia microti strain RI]
MDHKINLISGGFAGVFVDILLYPLDTLKTRSQVKFGVKFNKSQNFIFSNFGPNSKGLYSGLSVILSGSFPSSAAYYAVYEISKHSLAHYSLDGIKPFLPLTLVHVLSTSIAEISNSLIRTPFEVIKQQMQAGMHSTVKDSIKFIYKRQGYKGFYVGLGSVLLREIPFDGIQFVLWERSKTCILLQPFYEDKKSYVATSAITGGLAGGIAGILTTPIDVIKTRMMTQDKIVYKNSISCMRALIKEEGCGVLCRGMGFRAVWLTLSGLLFFGSLETAKLALTSNRQANKSEELDSVHSKLG